MTPWRQFCEAKSLQLVVCLFRLLPRRCSLRLGEFLGFLVYKLRIRTDVAAENLRNAFPELKSDRITAILRACYRHFGALLAEFARLPLLNENNVDDLVELSGWEIFEDVIAAGKGCIVVSGHLGNWELLGAAVVVKTYPVSYVVTTQRNKQVEGMMDEIRRRCGVQIIKRREAVKGVIKALKENRIVAILSDQDTHEAGVFVPFFGRPASTPRGAALFALRTGAPLVFAASFRQGTGPLKVSLERIEQTNLPSDPDDAIRELTERFTKRLEVAIREHPEQWFWMHRRWKTRPPEENEIKKPPV